MTLWVFAYGSLLWNPGFTPTDRIQAQLDGYSRSFCMLSFHYRGTPKTPGLVLALDKKQGAMCHGIAFCVAHDEQSTVTQYLRDRELITGAYKETYVPLRLCDGREITAMTFIIDPDHAQYVGYDLEKQAEMIACATGERGSNADYLLNTAQFLNNLEIYDPDIKWLSQRILDISKGNT